MRAFGRALYAQYKPVKSKSSSDWAEICSYLKSIHVEGMRKKICVNCNMGMLYDKNNVQYPIKRGYTMDTVKNIVEKIKKINNGDIRNEDSNAVVNGQDS